MRLRRFALGFSVFALVLLAASGPAVRLGAPVTLGILLLPIAGLFGLIAVILVIVAIVRSGFALALAAALLIGVAVAAVPIAGYLKARSVPPINDITTDTENPPRYMTASRAYPGAEFARQQRAAYPDIAPVLLPQPPREAFAKAVAAAEAMGWEVVGRDAAAGTLEAVDTTKWFGFKDDIAVRVVPTPNGSRIDIRSKSRVGRSDIGTNARRIRAYAERFK